jgi:hypothetical protein
MMSHPAIGQRVQLRYAKARAHLFPYHGMTGVIIATSRGHGPHNHAVRLDDATVVIVPAGNLIPAESEKP